MFKKSPALAALIVFGLVNGGECTQNEIVAKATLLANQICAHGLKNPDAFLPLMDEYEKDAAARLGKAPDSDKECAFYDEWIEKTK